VEHVHKGLERVADEGACGVEEVGGHDLEAGGLALLLSLVGAGDGDDLVDVVSQVGGGEQLLQLVDAQAVEDEALLDGSGCGQGVAKVLGELLEGRADEGA